MIQRKLSISHSVFLTFKAEKKKTEKMYQNSEMPSAKEKKIDYYIYTETMLSM